MMARTQITLDPEMQRSARRRAADLGISLAEYLRQLVARDLGGVRPGKTPEAVFDLGRSGRSNIARDKRTMLAEAFGASKLSRRK
jgi:hypothetical protein